MSFSSKSQMELPDDPPRTHFHNFTLEEFRMRCQEKLEPKKFPIYIPLEGVTSFIYLRVENEINQMGYETSCSSTTHLRIKERETESDSKDPKFEAFRIKCLKELEIAKYPVSLVIKLKDAEPAVYLQIEKELQQMGYRTSYSYLGKRIDLYIYEKEPRNPFPDHLYATETKSCKDTRLKKLRNRCIQQLELRQFPITVSLDNLQAPIYTQIEKELTDIGYDISYKNIGYESPDKNHLTIGFPIILEYNDTKVMVMVMVIDNPYK